MDEFYLMDSRSPLGSNAMFWALSGSYTSDLLKAEKFSREEALRQHKSRHSDIPVPCDYTPAHIRQRIDMQYLPEEATKQSAGEMEPPACVVVDMGKFDGNDCYFLGPRGFTFEFDQATRLSFEKALEYVQQSNMKLRIYLHASLSKIIRHSIDSQLVMPAMMATQAGYTLLKDAPRKERKVFNCIECGKFIGVSERYSSCNKCGASNY